MEGRNSPNAKVPMKQSVTLSLALVLFSNGLTWFIYATGTGRELVYFLGMVMLLTAALWWTRTSGGPSWEEIGLRGRDWRQSTLVGTIGGLVLALLLVIFMAFPALLAQPVQYREIQGLDALGLLWRLGAELTIATALTEEILFRGILQALFKRWLPMTPALISTNVAFALWHLVANALSIRQNLVVLPLIPIAAAQLIGYVSSLIAVGIGGLTLSILRERTRHLAGSLVMHWVAVAAMTISVYLR